MRAFVINEYAHPSKIALTKNAPEPTLDKDQVLVDVYSAGLNFFDVTIISSVFADPPN
jgi:NADPH:quinone reductase